MRGARAARRGPTSGHAGVRAGNTATRVRAGARSAVARQPEIERRATKVRVDAARSLGHRRSKGAGTGAAARSATGDREERAPARPREQRARGGGAATGVRGARAAAWIERREINASRRKEWRAGWEEEKEYMFPII